MSSLRPADLATHRRARRKLIATFAVACAVYLALALAAAVARAQATLEPPPFAPVIPAGGPRYATDRLIVRLTPTSAVTAAAHPPAGKMGASRTLGLAALDALAEQLDATFEREFPPLPTARDGAGDPLAAFYVVHLPGDGFADAPPAAVARFASLPEVAEAFGDAMLPVAAIPNDSLWSTSWHFFQPNRRDVHAPEAWDITRGDTAIVIGILDTGVLTEHPDLAANIARNAAEAAGLPGIDDDGNGFIDDVRGWDFVALASGTDVRDGEDWRDADNDPNDFAAHGTVVAGVAGAVTDNGRGPAGTAWNVRLLPLRVGVATNRYPLGEVTMSWVAQGLVYAARNGVTIANASFSSIQQGDLLAAMDEALAAGVTVVVAGGNNGSLHGMADRHEVIAVGASTESDQVAIFSNRGPYIDFLAPGTNIASTALTRTGTDSIGARQPSYTATANGTSFAAPIVSGAVALLQARRRTLGLPLLSPYDVQFRLRETTADVSADNLGFPGIGTGRLDLQRMLGNATTSRAHPLGAPSVGAAAVFATAAGELRAACATEAPELVLLAGAEVFRRVPLPARTVGHVAAADLGDGRGTAVFAALTSGRIMGFDEDAMPRGGWLASIDALPAGGPALGDLDGDGVLEIVCVTRGARISAWHANGSVVPGFPVTVTGTVEHPVALDDLDGVPGAEILVAAGSALHALNHGGTALAGWPVSVHAITAPVVTTLTDGRAVVVVGTPNGFDAIDSSGVTVVRSSFMHDGAGEAALGDLDLDGSDEVVFAQPEQFGATAFRLSTGAPLPGWPRELLAIPGGSPVIGQVAAGPAPEVLMFAGGALHAMRSDGSPIDHFPMPGGAGVAPTLQDLDGDGSTDVIAGTGAGDRLFLYDAGDGTAYNAAQDWPTARGNAARTGSRRYRPDITTPRYQRITDASATPRSTTTIEVRWTVPVDSLADAAHAGLELRRSPTPIRDDNFRLARLVPEVSVRGPAGTVQTVSLGGFEEGEGFYWAVRVRDAAGRVSGISDPVWVATPIVPPARITDLAHGPIRTSTVDLAWTAPGGDSTAGRASAYEIRYAQSALDESTFEFATPIANPPLPATGGATERVTVSGLPEGASLWIAARAVDPAGNRGALSNVVPFATPSVAPSAIGDLVVSAIGPSYVILRWTASGGDSSAGRADRTELRYAEVPLDDTNFATGTEVAGLAPPRTAGQTEGVTVHGLLEGRAWHFRLRTHDAAGNASALSNAVDGAVPHQPPVAVTTLEVITPIAGHATATWVAPADSGATGRAASYDLRISQAPITEANFDSATVVPGVPEPSQAGYLDSAPLTGLLEGASYWVALRSTDPAGNRSAISNVVPFAMPLLAPERVVTLAATWTDTTTGLITWIAPGDDGALGTAASYDLRRSMLPITEANFEAATVVPTGSPLPGRSFEFISLTGISRRANHYFALRAADALGNRSALSNIAVLNAGLAGPGVSDLVASFEGSGARLAWSAPEPSWEGGPHPVRYEIRTSTRAIDAGNFELAALLPDPPVPGPPGSTQEYLARELSEGLAHWFALRSVDEIEVPSLISNVIVVVPPSIPPADVADLRVVAIGDGWAEIVWTAVGDDGLTGMPTYYDVRMGDAPVTEATFDGIARRLVVPARVSPRATEFARLGALEDGRRYWLAVRAVDDVGARSFVVHTIPLQSSGNGWAFAPVVQPSRVPFEMIWQAPGRYSKRITVHDLAGRRLREIELGTAPGGVAAWDGLDEGGRAMGPGVYIARLEASGVRETMRIVLMR